MSRDEHDLRVRSSTSLALQVESIDVRKFHVQNETSWHLRLRIGEVLSSGAERHHVEIERRQKLRYRFADPPVIIHDENDMVLRVHSGAPRDQAFEQLTQVIETDRWLPLNSPRRSNQVTID